MREMQETQSNVMRTLEEMPTQTYIGLSLGSIILSAFFYLAGRRSTALFIGQWAPTFGILALVYKLLHPSREQPMEQIRQMGEEMREKAEQMGEGGHEAGSRARHRS